MLERPNHRRSVVMLTADRMIDRRILLQADSLEKEGWKVAIVALPHDHSTYEEDRRVIRLSAQATNVTRENIALHAYRYARSCVSMDSVVMRTAKSWAWRYLVDQEVFFIKLFENTVSRLSPDVFVAHDLPMLAVAQQQAERCGAKLVYDSHELYSEQEFSVREKKRWADIESKYIKKCDVIITVNESIALQLEKRYNIRDVKVIYNADYKVRVSSTKKIFHEFFSLPTTKRVLLLQGGLSSGRNLETLVGAMDYVTDSSIVLVILGDGVFKKTLTAKVKKLGLENRVFFHPAVPQNVLPTYTLAADAGVIPYQATCLNNHFCTPNKLFEFIAAGLPILATDLPEIKKFVIDTNIGLVGDTSNPVKLAKLINEFFSDKKRLMSWRANVASARENICWEVEEQKLIQIYNTLI